MSELTFREFLRVFNNLYKENNEVYHSLARRCGLSDSAFWIMYTLREQGRPLRQVELCSELCLSKQTVNSALKNLEAAGYIRMQSVPENRRNKEIHLTEEGIALAVRTVDVVFEVEKNAFLHLEEEERAGLLALERKHLTALRREADLVLREIAAEGRKRIAGAAIQGGESEYVSGD